MFSPPAFFCSMSAAQSAAPTVLVKAKNMPRMGTSSRRTAGTPKLSQISNYSYELDVPAHLAYAAFLFPTNSSLSLFDICLSWKYRACAVGPNLRPCSSTKRTVPTTGIMFSGR